MKKFSKILAVILTVCALSAFAAVFASADEAGYVEYKDTLDTIQTVTPNGWTATAVEVMDGDTLVNTYQKLSWTTANKTGSFKVLSNTNINTMAADNRYAVFQFLFTAEDGKYIEGYIRPGRGNDNHADTDIGGIQIKKEGDEFYAYWSRGNDKEIKANKAELTSNGDWNVVTVVMDRRSPTNNVGNRAWFYVNGIFLGGRDQSTGAHGYLTKLDFTAYDASLAGSNIIIDGFNARFYSNGSETGANATYTTPDTVGIDDFFKAASTAYASNDDFATLEDIYYSKYSTLEHYPATLVDGKPHYRDAIFVGGVGYVDASFALQHLEEGGTIQIRNDATITGVSVKNFTVEALDGAKASFGGDVAASSNILPGKHSDGIVRYVISPRVEIECVELTNDVNEALSNDGFASNGYRTWTPNSDGVQKHGTFGTLVTVNGNSYWKMYATTTINNGSGTNGAASFIIGGTNATADTWTDEDITNFKYTATEYLFMAEGLNYVDGMSIEIRSDYKQSQSTKNLGRVYIINKDGVWYASADGTKAGVALSTTEGAWNMVSQVSAITNADKDARTATVVTHIFVNGQYLTSSTTEGKILGSMTSICFNGHKNSTANPGDNICVDGITVRNFGTLTEDYVSTEYYGIDDFFTDYNNSVAGVSPINCDDIVYNYATTVLPETNGRQEFKASINGDYSFLYADSAFLYVEDGDVVTLFVDHKVEALPATVKTIYFDGSGVVSFSDAILENYAFLDGVLVKNINYIVNWLLAEGETPFKTENITYTITSPTRPNAGTLADVVTDILGDYNLASAWKYRIGDGEYAALADFEICDDGDTVTIIPVIATVKWYHVDGSLMANELWFVGSAIAVQTPDLYEGGVQDNGWYEVVYDWNSTDFIAKEGVTEYKQVKAPYSALDIRFNFSLDGGLAPTYYVSAPLKNVKIKSVLASRDFESGEIYNYANSYERVKIDGREYYVYNLGGVSLADYEAIYSFQVIYEIEIDGHTYTLESKIAKASIAYEAEDVVAYAKAVLQNASATGCSEETEFIASLIALVRETGALENDTAIDAIIDAYVAAHKAENDGCTCFGDTTQNLPHASDVKVSYKAITDIGAEIYYVVSENGPKLTVKVPKTVVATRAELSVSASLVGIDYNDAKNRNELGKNINVSFRYSGEDQEFFIYTANVGALKAYNADSVQKIVISRGDVAIATGTFSLAEYVYRMNEALDFYEWSNVDSDNNGNIDGFIPNPEPIGDEAEAKEFNALLAYLNFAKVSKEFITAE